MIVKFVKNRDNFYGKLREGSLYQNGLLLGSLPKGRGGEFRTAFFKMYLVLIFINTIVEKHNLKRPLCINFMVK